MKKLKNRAGFSLIEMLTAIAILVILVVGMDAGISAGLRAYKESIFESNSAALSGILNTAIGDLLRYSEDVRINPALDPESHGSSGFQNKDGLVLGPEQVSFVFSNYEYGIRNGYFDTEAFAGGSSSGVLQIRDLQKSKFKPNAPTEDEKLCLDVVNTGAYPDLAITNFSISYHAPDPDVVGPENYFDVQYDILDMKDSSRRRSVEYTVRLINPELSE